MKLVKSRVAAITGSGGGSPFLTLLQFSYAKEGHGDLTFGQAAQELWILHKGRPKP